MYEYAPKFAKKKEKLLTVLALVAGLAIYFLAYVPGMPFPGLVQIVGVCGIAIMILLYSLVVVRNYVYTIEEAEEGGLDFIITEFYGRRRTVVCRVAVTSVQMAVPRTEESRKSIGSGKGRKHVYNYTGVLFDEDRYYLRMNEGGEEFVVQICANKDLISALTNH